jgi:predicted permease
VDPDRVLVAIVGGALAGPDTATRFTRIDQVRQALAVVPGVEAVSGGVVTPLSSAMSATTVEVPGTLYKPAAGADGTVVLNSGTSPFTTFNRVLPDFFRVVGTPMVTGREFEDRDQATTTPVAVVNQAFATRHFGAGNPLGRTIIAARKTLEIVGVVADSRQLNLRETAPIPMAFGLLSQMTPGGPIPSLRFAVRTQDPQGLRAAAAVAIRSVDPRLNIEFRTMRDEADASINRERLMAWLAALFAVLGLAMAVIGLYGTFTYAVARRRAEIGVRMALGAERTDILRMVLREVAVVLAIGTVVGLAGALASGQLLQSLLVLTSARDPWMLATATASVIGAALVASLVPARRASRTDPMVALREE